MNRKQLKGHALAFGMFMGFMLAMALSAKSQSLQLVGNKYEYNSISFDDNVDLSIYDWDYWVVSIGDVKDTARYTHKNEYKEGRRRRLTVYVFDEESPIDSLSLGWTNGAFVRYKNGDTYSFPELYRPSNKDL